MGFLICAGWAMDFVMQVKRRKRPAFQLLLTSHELLMRDAARLSSLRWHYLVIDEGHRLKNSRCRLNMELKSYRVAHRLLLTGDRSHHTGLKLHLRRVQHAGDKSSESGVDF
jgi:Rad3-related DNA helicase